MEYLNSNNNMAVVVCERDTSVRRLPEEEVAKMMSGIVDVSAHADSNGTNMIVHFLFPNHYLHPNDTKKIKQSVEDDGGELHHKR